MKGFSYKVNYFCCFFSLFGALISAMTHQLGVLLLNFFFAVVNWYVAEYKRGLENEKDTGNSDDSGSDDDPQDEE